ncbi:MAG: TIM-barrel domain-containing protein [Bryobacteraceae bacterium]|jgi:alpha-glucosidase
MPPARNVDGGVEYRNQQGIVQLTVAGPGTVRVRFTPGKELGAGDSYAVLPAAAQPPRAAFQFSSQGAVDRLRTDLLTIEIGRSPFRLRFLDAAGRLFDRDTGAMGMAYDPEGRVRVWKELEPDSHFFGFGEKAGLLDKRGGWNGGSSLVMWNSDTYGYDNTTDPLYDTIPFFMTLRNGVAHGTFLDNTSWSSFDVGRESPKSINFGAESGELDYYIIAGPSPADVLRRYAELTGPMPMPPLWALGYQQCRYSYYPDSRVMEIARGFRERHIPADAIWLDIHYMDGYRIFTWDPRRFPHPVEMMRDLGDLHFKTVSIIDPGVKLDPGYAAYDSGVKAGVFVKNPDGKLYSGRVWPGAAVFADFTDAPARKWWADRIAEFAAKGQAGIWVDMNEPSIFDGLTMPDDVVFHRAGAAVSHARIHNVFGQQMSRATQEGLLQLHPDQRPFVLTRSTYAGGQRYAAVWTGDNVADWPHLEDGLGTLLGMGISGFPFVGNDIGGFKDSGPADADLFTRWMEAGTFFPFMRAHTVPEAANKEPWAFGPEHEAYNRHAIERRYRFLPYIYNSFYQASQTGIPIMRALLLQYPEDPATYTISDEFLVGPDLLVAPILARQTTARQVYLPRGAWYDLRTDKALEGAKRIDVEAAEDDVPLFVPEGAILFRAPVMQSTMEWPASELIFDVFCHGATDREYYEDDGSTFAYRQQGYFKRTVSVRTETGGITVTLGAAQGSFTPQHIRNTVVLHFAHAPRGVSLDGRDLAPEAIQFDQARSVLSLQVPQSGEQQKIVVRW